MSDEKRSSIFWNCSNFVFKFLTREIKAVEPGLFGDIENLLTTNHGAEKSTVEKILSSLREETPDAEFQAAQPLPEMNDILKSIYKKETPYNPKKGIREGISLLTGVLLVGEIVFRISHLFRKECSDSCPQMAVAGKLSFQWREGEQMATVPASTYIDLFYEKLFLEFTQENYQSKKIVEKPLRKFTKHFLRILGHFYFRHMKQVDTIRLSPKKALLKQANKTSVLYACHILEKSSLLPTTAGQEKWEWCPECSALIVDELSPILSCIYCNQRIHDYCGGTFATSSCSVLKLGRTTPSPRPPEKERSGMIRDLSPFNRKKREFSPPSLKGEVDSAQFGRRERRTSEKHLSDLRKSPKKFRESFNESRKKNLAESCPTGREQLSGAEQLHRNRVVSLAVPEKSLGKMKEKKISEIITVRAQDQAWCFQAASTPRNIFSKLGEKWKNGALYKLTDLITPVEMSCDLGLEALADISPKWEIRAPPNLKIKIEIILGHDQTPPKQSTVSKMIKNNPPKQLYDFLLSSEATATFGTNRHSIYHLLCKYGKSDAIALALENKIDVNPMGLDSCGQQPLHHACFHGKLECALALLKKGVSVSRKTLNGHTPLHMLAASPRLESSLKEQSSVQLFQEVLLLFAERGCDFSLENWEGKTPIGLILRHKYSLILKTFLLFVSGLVIPEIPKRTFPLIIEEDYDEILQDPDCHEKVDFQRCLLIHRLQQLIVKKKMDILTGCEKNPEQSSFFSKKKNRFVPPISPQPPSKPARHRNRNKSTDLQSKDLEKFVTPVLPEGGATVEVDDATDISALSEISASFGDLGLDTVPSNSFSITLPDLGKEPELVLTGRILSEKERDSLSPISPLSDSGSSSLPIDEFENDPYSNDFSASDSFTSDSLVSTDPYSTDFSFGATDPYLNDSFGASTDPYSDFSPSPDASSSQTNSSQPLKDPDLASNPYSDATDLEEKKDVTFLYQDSFDLSGEQVGTSPSPDGYAQFEMDQKGSKVKRGSRKGGSKREKKKKKPKRKKARASNYPGYGSHFGGFDQFSSQGRRSDWIVRFQKALGMIREVTKPLQEGIHPLFVEDAVRKQILVANTCLIELEQDFIATAKTYGRIIISERFLEKKTIQPISIGGMAGGEKYIVHNILFKFAVDANGIYQGDYGAAKVAGHELKGATAYYNALIDQNVCLPMLALVDYLGFRLIVMSVLPIDKSTLIYGTADGGHSLLDSDTHFNNIMQVGAQRLNLQSHYCGLRMEEDKEGVFLHSAADVEGHLGKDGKYYLLDFSRTFPPCPPRKEIPASHLFYLFRQEFVKKFKKPLCPDAYSGFVLADPNRKEYNEDAIEALELLLTYCADFARIFSGMISQATTFEEHIELPLTRFLHSSGINLRFLGVVLKHSESGISKVRVYYLCEMIARVMKNEIRAILRSVMETIRIPMEASYRMVVAKYLNMVLVETGSKSQDYWDSILKSLLQTYFNVSSPYIDEEFDLRTFIKKEKEFSSMKFLLVKLSELTRINLSSFAFEKVDKGALLEDFDVVGFEEKVNNINIIADAKGVNYTLFGLHHFESGDILTSKYFLQMAEEEFKSALASNPQDRSLLEHFALSSAGSLIVKYIVEKKVQCKMRPRNWPKVSLSSSDPDVVAVENAFIASVKHSTNPTFFYFYASFLDLTAQYRKAESYFFRSFEIKLTVPVLESYVEFLREREDPSLSAFAEVLGPLVKVLRNLNRKKQKMRDLRLVKEKSKRKKEKQK